MRRAFTIALLTVLTVSAVGVAYPLDGYDATGIRRLLAIRLAVEGKISGPEQPPGAMLPLAAVDLRLADRSGLTIPPPDPELTRKLAEMLGEDADSYGLAVLDLTDPDQIRYGEHRGDYVQNVGSVGKLVAAVALFQGLADAWPDDVAQRRQVLRETILTADAFSQSDHHTVRFFDPETNKVSRRTIKIGDQASLYEYLDWMLSPSSNSAAGMVMREAMLLRQFGRAYPLSEAAIDQFFDETPRQELRALFDKTFVEPLTRNGLDIKLLRQGSFFTAQGKRLVPGVGVSYGSARELTRLAVLLEKGQLVDRFSSREIKRLIYVTERRIRYAASRALAPAAVYFKSGSLYSCKPEEGFECRPYQGNERNYMNSVAIVESPAADRRFHYVVTIVSNVLRKNSASVHASLAARIQKLIESMHPGQAGADQP